MHLADPMLDTLPETYPDRRPAIILCACELDDAAAFGAACADGWDPAGARTRVIGPGDPASLATSITSELQKSDCRAVLLVSRTSRTQGFRIQMRAENRASTGGAKLSKTGPATARATAPAAEIVRALSAAGLSANATSDCEDDAASHLLYRILTALPDAVDAPSVGLLRAPETTDPESLLTGIRVATSVMARHLSLLPRSRFSGRE